MFKKMLFLLILTITLACSSDDNNNGGADDIDQWNLTQYQAGFIFIDNFAQDDVTWSFNFTTNVLTVVNNVEATYPTLLPSGDYNFSFENNQVTFQYINQPYIAEYDQSENDTMLTMFFDLIPEAIDDEVSYDFEKVE